MIKSGLFVFLYSFANVFRTVDIYLFYETFFPKKDNKKIKVGAYIVYYLAVTLEYLFIDLPVLTLLLNIFGLFIITLTYKTSMKRRFLATGFMMALLSVSETLILALTGYVSFSFFAHGYYSSLAGLVCMPILPFVSALLYRRKKQKDEDISIPISYWVTVIIVPISCIYTVLLCFSFSDIQSWQVISITIIMFAITISVFLLYERQKNFFAEENRKQMLEVQNLHYRNQLEEMLVVENSTRSLKHDMKNHLISIAMLAHDNDNVEIVNYVNKLQDDLKPFSAYINTGNLVIDSILNYKITLAKEKGISINCNVVIPEELNINDMDMTVLLGNLVDNAIENADKAEDKNILFEMRYDKGRIIICCQNAYVGQLKRRGNFYYTIKSDKRNHGFGLQNMSRVVEKYGGMMRIDEKEGQFIVRILLIL